VTAQSLIIGWLYNASGGSLPVAIVAHSAHDTADGLRLAVTTDTQAAADLLQLALYVTAAIAVVVLTHGRLGMRPTVGAATMIGQRPNAVAP